MKDINEMTNEEFEKEFIQWFGEEVWHQLEVLRYIENLVTDVCKNWLGIEPIPVLFGEHMGNDDGKLDLKEQVIWLNPKNVDNKIQLMNITIHEFEHLYQSIYIQNFDTPKAKRWRKEMNNYIGGDNPIAYIMQEIEIDAHAFSQIVLATDYGIIYNHPDPIVQLMIDKYIKSKKILKDD